MAILVVCYDNSTGGFRIQKVGSAQISDGAIVSAKVAAGAIGTPHIASGLDAARIASGSTLPAITMGGDISLGANKLKTTNLSLYEVDANTLWLRNAAANAERDLYLRTLRPTTSILAAGGTNTFDTYPADAAFYWAFRAYDRDGAALAEVARIMNANDPYFQATLPMVLNPSVEPGALVEGHFWLASGLGVLKYRGVATTKTVAVDPVLSGAIASGQVGIPHIYPGAITSAKIGANVIGNTHLYSGKVQHTRLGGVTANLHHAEFTSGMHNFPHPSALIAANAIVSGKVASGGLSPLSSGKIWAGYTGNIAREENKPTASDGYGAGELTVTGFQINAATGTCTNVERLNNGNLTDPVWDGDVGEYCEVTLPNPLRITQWRQYGNAGSINGDGVLKLQYEDVNEQWHDWVTGISTRNVASWTSWASATEVVAIAIRLVVTTADSNGDKGVTAELEVKY